MPVEIPTDLPAELVPFAWLLGQWQGDGFVGYGDWTGPALATLIGVGRTAKALAASIAADLGQPC